MTEQEFLNSYDSSQYEKPSVAVDILIFTVNDDQRLELLLIKRGEHPFIDKWAIPGGFVDVCESIEAAAIRELKEETGLNHIYLEQLYTFGDVNRDPRMRVISVAYMALIPQNHMDIQAGDDAAEAALFLIQQDEHGYTFHNKDNHIILTESDLAFDHSLIIRTALERLSGKLEYTNISFELLHDKYRFSIYELQRIYEAITCTEENNANFKKSFIRRYVNSGKVMMLNEKCTKFSKRPSNYYSITEKL